MSQVFEHTDQRVHGNQRMQEGANEALQRGVEFVDHEESRNGQKIRLDDRCQRGFLHDHPVDGEKHPEAGEIGSSRETDRQTAKARTRPKLAHEVCRKRDSREIR